MQELMASWWSWWERDMIELVLHEACVVLAYVSRGSFISQAADPCWQVPGQRGGSPNLGANCGSDA